MARPDPDLIFDAAVFSEVERGSTARDRKLHCSNCNKLLAFYHGTAASSCADYFCRTCHRINKLKE